MSVEKEKKSNLPEVCIIPTETDSFEEWMSENDYWKIFHDTGTVLQWAKFDTDGQLYVHLIQPNRLHFLGQFDNEANMLFTIVKNLTKEQIVKYLKEYTTVDDPWVFDYDEYVDDQYDDFNEIFDNIIG